MRTLFVASFAIVLVLAGCAAPSGGGGGGNPAAALLLLQGTRHAPPVFGSPRAQTCFTSSVGPSGSVVCR